MVRPSGREIRTFNPWNEEALALYPVQSWEELSAVLDRGFAAGRELGGELMEKRADGLRRLAGLLRGHADELGRLITAEMGKPLTEALKEVEKSASACDTYADQGPGRLQAFLGEQAQGNGVVRAEGGGLVLLVMPWNFPVWQAVRQAAPNLLLGNALILKHAPNTTGCGLRLAELVTSAFGGTDGFFTAVVADDDSTHRMIADERVRGVAFTGSTQTGRKIGQTAGANLKKSVLELGGSDAYIVLEDADLDLAVEQIFKARFQNAGQSCIAAKRALIHRARKGEFIGKLIQRLDGLQIGDPSLLTTTMGPLARGDLVTGLRQQVERSLREGVQVAYEGKIESFRHGFFYPPMILEVDDDRSTPFREELFGPVLSVTPFSGANEAVQLANSSPFGLGGAIFSKDRRLAELMADEMHCGGIAINTAYHSDAKIPFGGAKYSGVGRELGIFGLIEFANIKAIIS